MTPLMPKLGAHLRGKPCVDQRLQWQDAAGNERGEYVSVLNRAGFAGGSNS